MQANFHMASRCNSAESIKCGDSGAIFPRHPGANGRTMVAAGAPCKKLGTSNFLHCNLVPIG